MKRSSAKAAFTLVETLVGTVVLLLIMVLASQMTGATLATISHSTHTLDASESIRSTVLMLREELAGVTVSQREGRYLNLRVLEDTPGVSLYFAVPRAHTAELSRMGFVSHLAYVWDRESRTLVRAEYHSSREPETVGNTAVSPDSTSLAANLARLRKLTPAYQGSDPYAWIAMPFWEERLKKARRNPLLTDISEWKLDAFRTTSIDSEKPAINEWTDPKTLPTLLRVSFVMNRDRRVVMDDGEKKSVGRRYVSVIPLPGNVPAL